MFSIVVLSRDPSNLKACYQAVHRAEPSLAPDRFICVDDGAGSDPDATKLGITWLPGAQPFIFARNANIGLRHAFDEQKSDFAILLNDDAMLKTRRGFSRLVEVQSSYSDYGLLAPSTNNVGNPNQEQQAGSMIIRREKRMLCFICVSISAAVWQRVGGLDERFIGYGFEDDDYSRRVIDAGFRLGIYDPIFVDHSQLKSTFRATDIALHSERFEQNKQLFRDKWDV